MCTYVDMETKQGYVNQNRSLSYKSPVHTIIHHTVIMHTVQYKHFYDLLYNNCLLIPTHPHSKEFPFIHEQSTYDQLSKRTSREQLLTQFCIE